MRFTKMDKEPEIAPIYCGHLLRKRTLNSCFSAIFHKSNFDSLLRSFDHPFLLLLSRSNRFFVALLAVGNNIVDLLLIKDFRLTIVALPWYLRPPRFSPSCLFPFSPLESFRPWMNKREHVENRKEEGGTKDQTVRRQAMKTIFPRTPLLINLSSAKPMYSFSNDTWAAHPQGWAESTGIEAVIGIRSLSSRPVTSTNDIQIPLEQIRDVRLTTFGLQRPSSLFFFLSPSPSFRGRVSRCRGIMAGREGGRGVGRKGGGERKERLNREYGWGI